MHVVTNPHVNRIVMVDGPVVIGWKTWRELQAADGLGIVTAAIEDGMRSGSIGVRDPEPLYQRAWVGVRINTHLHQQLHYSSPDGGQDIDETWID